METIEIFNKYEEASSQRVNLDKSKVSLSKGIHQDRGDELGELLNMMQVEEHNEYLGAPQLWEIKKEDF